MVDQPGEDFGSFHHGADAHGVGEESACIMSEIGPAARAALAHVAIGRSFSQDVAVVSLLARFNESHQSFAALRDYGCLTTTKAW